MDVIEYHDFYYHVYSFMFGRNLQYLHINSLPWPQMILACSYFISATSKTYENMYYTTNCSYYSQNLEKVIFPPFFPEEMGCNKFKTVLNGFGMLIFDFSILKNV